MTVDYVRTQVFFSAENYTYGVVSGDTATTWYTMDGGYYYTYGSYLGNGEYSLGETKESPDATDPNNNLKYESGKYTINGKSLSNDIDPEYRSKEIFKYINSTEENVINRGYKLGYDYIKGAYYTINGAQVDSNKKYAEYSRVENPSGLTSDGVNYIQIPYHYTDAEGNPQTTTVWYQFSKSTSSGDYEYIDLIENGLTSTPESITITAYPSSFVNPYTTDTVGDLYAGEEIYGNSDLKLDFFGDAEISQEVTYYYFDGGYEVYKDDGISYVFAPLGEIDYDSWEMPIYDASGNKIVTINLIADDENKIEDIIDKIEANSNNYITNVSAFDAGERAMFRVGYNYRVYNDTIYVLQSGYIVNEMYGYLQQVRTNANSEGDYTVDYNYNKYLSNRTYGIYTRYMYVNETGNPSDLSFTLWPIYRVNEGENGVTVKESNYTLIPKSTIYSGSPNGKTTYLTESVKVTLGGNLSLQHTGVGNITSGSITIITE